MCVHMCQLLCFLILSCTFVLPKDASCRSMECMLFGCKKKRTTPRNSACRRYVCVSLARTRQKNEKQRVFIHVPEECFISRGGMAVYGINIHFFPQIETKRRAYSSCKGQILLSVLVHSFRAICM